LGNEEEQAVEGIVIYYPVVVIATNGIGKSFFQIFLLFRNEIEKNISTVCMACSIIKQHSGYDCPS